MKTAIGFLGGPALDYGTRLARLRWMRAIPAPAADLRPGAPATPSLAAADLWVLVREPSAVPAGATGEPPPTPGPGRVMLVSGCMSAGPTPPHTLRELQMAGVRPCPGAPSEAPALVFRAADFPARAGETIEAFVKRLLGQGALQEWAPRLAALTFGDPSERERPEISAELPARALRLLDVGCGAAATSAAFRARYPASLVTGIERDPGSAAVARMSLSRVLVGDAVEMLERLVRAGETFDAFLFADVLEHLDDPVRALALARQVAAPGASLVATVPNTGHISVARDLLAGRFDPVPAGLLDTGHLRWFTRASLAEFLEEAGWRSLAIRSLPGAPAGDADEFLKHFSGWPDLDRESLTTYQWLAVARVAEGPDVAPERPECSDRVLTALDFPPPHLLRFGEVNRFRGMVLDRRGGVARCVRVRIDGGPPVEHPSDCPSEELVAHLPRLPAARNCRFDFQLRVPSTARLLEFAAVWEDGQSEPLFEYELESVRQSSEWLERMRRGLAALAMPPGDVVFLTQGHRDVEGYRNSIIPGLWNMRRYLTASGIPTDQIESVLDFGCGSGRTLAAWWLDDPARWLVGCDANRTLAGWAREHLPKGVRVEHTSPLPPLPFGDVEFDLAVALSVFTHFRFQTQELWAQELARVLRPEGTLLVTVHGRSYVELFMPERLAEFDREGHVEVEREDGSNDSASFHAPRVVRRLFSRFEVVGEFPGGRIAGGRVLFPLAGLQDVYVLRLARAG